MAQKDINPYIYSDSNKRYLTYDRYMKMRFGGKVAKVPLDIGCTCPNIDGSAGYGGCIYCKNGSSSAIGKSIDEQYQNGVNVMNRKWNNVGYIPYFQSNSNTYGSLAHLEKSYFMSQRYTYAPSPAISSALKKLSTFLRLSSVISTICPSFE